jgi:hypothetical protein
MMSHFEAEPRATKPPDFEEWVTDLAEIAETEGVWMLTMAWMYAPVECCAYLMRVPGLMTMLMQRAKYTDQQRATRSGMSSMSMPRVS